ncbi:hypothetical protein DNL40_08075 [Xylanimonas oleitrophica]|uniref:Uncharacterized protein n=1 Tax=Xylanimonas oleitrophica TaxID=2607479 RepID=A0A2W5WS42_9MICO|nr:hypothetical protein [Xylanimonas oleitrophica]PZR53453.1 hypothetical protein DNL40_08075 [Xylanimonas oleitrophica]
MTMDACDHGDHGDLRLADHATLLEIAAVIDGVVACSAALGAGAPSGPELRRELFALLDLPRQATWERVRELEVVPSFLPGLQGPGPVGLCVADLVYAYGLPDAVCPSRAALLRALRWAVDEHGASAQG